MNKVQLPLLEIVTPENKLQLDPRTRKLGQDNVRFAKALLQRSYSQNRAEAS